MMDLPSKAVRQERGTHAQYKADVYDSTDAPLFIESDPRQAEEITQRTNKPVLCYESMEMVQPGRAKRTHRKTARLASRFRKNPVSFSVLAAKHLVHRSYYSVSERIS